MKKSKILIYAALAASTVAISSCSDNDVLDSTTKAKGNALIVNASLNEGSRIATKVSDDFKNFRLFGFQNPQTGDTEEVGGFLRTGDNLGVDFTGKLNNPWTVGAGVTASWPTVNPTNSNNFYAISFGENEFSLDGTGVTISDAYIKQGKFVYEAPKDGDGNVDLAAQKDILVAKSLNTLQETNGGVLNLPFEHAFAKLSLQIRFNSHENDKSTGDINENYKYTICAIEIHNVKVSGTYDYTTGLWDTSGDGNMGTIIYKFAPGTKTITAGKHEDDNLGYQDLLAGANSIMIVPQECSGTWAYNKTSPVTKTAAGSAPYVAILGWIWDSDTSYNNGFPTNKMPDQFDLDNEDDVDVMGNLSTITGGTGHENLDPGYLFYPIQITTITYGSDPTDPNKQIEINRVLDNFIFKPNKEYNLILNPYNAMYENGKHGLTPASQS